MTLSWMHAPSDRSVSWLFELQDEPALIRFCALRMEDGSWPSRDLCMVVHDLCTGRTESAIGVRADSSGF
jgi:hypothetical protein